MATMVIDDVTGDPIKDGDAMKMSLGLDGQWYELEVSSETEGRVREWVEDVLQHARKVSAPKAARTYDAAVVRKWAEEQGLEVPARGRLPRTVVDQWREATQN